MLDMQVIEALYLKDEADEEPHDYLHIKHERMPSRLQQIPATGWRPTTITLSLGR